MSPCAPSPSSRRPKIIEQASVLATPQRSHLDAAGEVLKLRTIGPFTLREIVYPAGLVLPYHSHREAFITFVIEGTFHETYSSGGTVCRPGGVRFLPAGELHRNEMDSDLRCLNISSDQEAFDRFARQAVVPKTPAQINGLTATWLANRLYAEFSKEDAPSGVAIEGLVLAILAEIARAEAMPHSALFPRWLTHATEIVETRFLERLSLTEIAAEVGVHYVHLSRQFHKYNRCTIGEMIRRRRVQYASHLLAHSQTPLAEIALICGFSDQSHLSFLFKRYMGLSPSKFRSLAGHDLGPRSLYGVSGAEALAAGASAVGK